MKYTVNFSNPAKKVIKKWKKSNPRAYSKLYDDLLPELVLHPRTGKGHPHPLVSSDGVTYSRHITAHDRIIYDIYDDVVTVLVVQIEGHYDDK
ncbi:MAG: type II toxin-antitoxin system YoeB family toxin [Bacteroidaceae bacterium]|nr:type II toxin-antitoxin system YoeB family toxin [Bacteroidaceae bacterium]